MTTEPTPTREQVEHDISYFERSPLIHETQLVKSKQLLVALDRIAEQAAEIKALRELLKRSPHPHWILDKCQQWTDAEIDAALTEMKEPQ